MRSWKVKELVLVIALGAIGILALGRGLRYPALPPALQEAAIQAACPPAGCAPTQVRFWKENLQAEAVDLNGDRQPEYLVRLPGDSRQGGGNTTWVFQQARPGTFVLLVVGSTLSAQSQSNAGWRDLEGAIWYPDGTSAPYRFVHDGTVYRIAAESSASEEEGAALL